MPEWVPWAGWLVGCFWCGAVVAAALSGSLGFVGGYMWSGLQGRRNARRLLDRMIQDETARVAAQARREDVEAAAALAQHAVEMADLVLRAMEDERAPVG